MVLGHCATQSKTFSSHPYKKPHYRSPDPLHPLPSHWQPPEVYCLYRIMSVFWAFHLNGLIQYVAFCVWQSFSKRNIYACLPYAIYLFLIELSGSNLCSFLVGLLSHAQALRFLLFCIQAPLCVLQVFFSNLWLTFHFFQKCLLQV